jgi:hypothetical protein
VKPLYEISDALRSVLDELADADGELVGDLDARLSAAEGDMARKVDAVLAYAAERKADSAACSAEAKRLTERARAADAHAERLRDYVLRCMTEAGVQRVDGARFKAALSQTPGRVVVSDEMALPLAMIRTTQEPDKSAIRAALLAGEHVPGAHMETSVTLRVR